MAVGKEIRESPDIRRVHRCPQCGEPLISVPVLECAHCGEKHSLRALVYKKGNDQFIAECVDLDLLSQGTTKEQAIAKLQEAMHGYLATAFDGRSTKGLVLRPSPFSHRLRYHIHSFAERLGVFSMRRHRKHLMIGASDNRICHC